MTTPRLTLFGRPALRWDGRPAAVGNRSMLLLARLAVEPTRQLSIQRLVDDLWPDRRVSDSTLRVLVNRTRRLVGPERLPHLSGHYALVDVDVDVDAFERELALARRDQLPLARRVASYRRALELSRQNALDGMRDPPWAQPIAQRLDELAEQALDEWAELSIEHGRFADVIADLGAAMTRTLTRERRCELVAIAHYRGGDQTAALRTIDRTRRALRDDLGLNLGGRLQQLETQILAMAPDGAGHDGRGRDAGQLRQHPAEARLQAASTLIQIGAIDEARTMLDSITLTGDAAADSPVAGRAALARAQLEMATPGGNPHPDIDRAQHVARSLGDGPLLARAATIRFAAGSPDDRTSALAELLEPLQLLSMDAEERVHLLCIAAALANFGDSPSSAWRLLDEAQRADAAIGTERTGGTVKAIRSIVTPLSADSIDCVADDAAGALSAARELGDHALFVAAAHAMLRVHFAHGRFGEIVGLLDDLDLAARRAVMPTVSIRPWLCRSTIALARGRLDEAERETDGARRIGDEYRAFGMQTAPQVQQLMLAFERDEPGLGQIVATMADAMPDTVWTAVAAVTGDEARADALRDSIDDVPRDDYHRAFVAFTAMVAAARGDAELGEWCLRELAEAGDQTVVVGLGTVVLGFTSHFRGLSLVATGRVELAIGEFDRAIDLAESAGAVLWRDHSVIERASAWVGSGQALRSPERRRVRALTVDGPSPRVVRRARGVWNAHRRPVGGIAAGG